MKAKTALLSAAIVLAACSEESGITPSGFLGNHEGTSLAITQAEDFIPADGTRAELNPTGQTIAFAWQESDKLGIYAGATASGLTNFDIERLDTEKPSHAIFKSNGFQLTAGQTYYGFYPYNPAYTSKNSVSVKYGSSTRTGSIVQTTDAGYSHLGSIDYQWASGIAAGSTAAADIKFTLKHLGAICRFHITGVPAAVKFSRLSISCDGIITDGTVDLTATTPVIAAATQGNLSTQNITLGSNDGAGFAATTAQGNATGTLTFYTMMAPADLSGKKITLSLYSDHSDMTVWQTTVDGRNMAAGKAYGYVASYAAGSATETDDWVDLGLKRDDGSPILFGKKNLGADSENAVGTMPIWTATDPVTARRGSNWRTPSERELHMLFSDQSLTWKKTDGGLTVRSTAKGTSLFLPFTDGTSCRYWTSTAVSSYWQIAKLTNESYEAARVNSYYCQKYFDSDKNIVTSCGTTSQTTNNTLAIRPVYVGPTDN